MDLRKEDFPATLQAFELQNDKEVFVAEQVVNSQTEIETFTSRYTGKLIKATKLRAVDQSTGNGHTVYKKRRSSWGLIMIIIILIVVALVLYGFSTGWIQEKLNLKI